MPRDPRAWLADIVAACDLLIEFTRGKRSPITPAMPCCGQLWSVSSR